MVLDGFIGKSVNDRLHQQQSIGFFGAKGNRWQKVTLHYKIAFVRLEAYRNALLAQRLMSL